MAMWMQWSCIYCGLCGTLARIALLAETGNLFAKDFLIPEVIDAVNIRTLKALAVKLVVRGSPLSLLLRVRRDLTVPGPPSLCERPRQQIYE
jgi:hypothetical protein